MFTGNLEALLAQVDPALQQELRKELLEHRRMDAIETVKCRYDPKRYSPYKGARNSNAALLGLTPIGRDSAFASLVAVHPNFDDMVIKVVDWNDAGAWYLRACHDGTISGPHAPVVYAVHRMGEQAFIYMERLIDVNDMPENRDEYVDSVNSFCRGYEDSCIDGSIETWLLQFKQWNLHPNGEFRRFCTDFHSGNCMFRADGTLVFIDPVHGSLDTESQRLEKKQVRERYAAERQRREEYRQARAQVEGNPFPRLGDMLAAAIDRAEMPVHRVEEYYCPRRREHRRRAVKPMLAMDHMAHKAVFMERDKPIIQNVQNICNGKPHARILQRDHNIRGFKK